MGRRPQPERRAALLRACTDELLRNGLPGLTLAKMGPYARLCAWTLARAHSRSGDSSAIAGYLGSSDVFDRAVAAFAEAYADQNERDYGALLEAIDSGRIEAQTGV